MAKPATGSDDGPEMWCAGSPEGPSKANTAE